MTTNETTQKVERILYGMSIYAKQNKCDFEVEMERDAVNDIPLLQVYFHENGFVLFFNVMYARELIYIEEHDEKTIPPGKIPSSHMSFEDFVAWQEFFLTVKEE